jgi:hypothetical protein
MNLVSIGRLDLPVTADSRLRLKHKIKATSIEVPDTFPEFWVNEVAVAA